MDEKRFEEIIRRGLYDANLQAGAKRTSALLKKRPFQPKELLLKYIDLALELGPSALLSPQGGNLSFIVYYNLDLITFCVSFVLILLYVVISIARKLFSLFTRTSTKQKKH